MPRYINAIALQNLKRLGATAGIRHGRAAGDDAGVVTRHVADGQCHHARRCAGSGQAPALDARQMLAHAVHLANAGAAVEQGLVHCLLVGQRHAFGRQGQQRRAAARDQAQHQIVRRQPLRQRQHALCRLHAGGVGHRVRGLHQLNAFGQPRRALGYVVVTRDHQTAERRVLGPQRLHGLRHRATGLAGAQHQGTTLGRLGQVSGGVVQRQRAHYRGLVQALQKSARMGLGLWCHGCYVSW